MADLSTEIPVPPTSGSAPAADADFQPYLLLVFVLIVVAVGVQNLWLRRRSEAEKRDSEGKEDDS